MWYTGLKEEKLFRIFDEISKVPRESGNEEGIRNFIISWCKENGIEAEKDEIGNVIMHVPATEGYEDVPSIAFQGHMDMVCVKTSTSEHDFTKDPIDIIREGNIIKAKDTSLGGDNGIAIALMLALFTDKSLRHGKLEGILTVEEETGLRGAFNLDASKIVSRKMINLDSEEEGIIYIGCAGGLDMESSHPVTYIPNPFTHTYKIDVSGLKGGHSGGDIGRERGNAIKVLSRILSGYDEPYSLSVFSAGTKRNVIPSHATAVISTDGNLKEKAASEIEAIKRELRYSDKNVSISISETANIKMVIREEETKEIIELLYIAPNAVSHMSMAIEGIVETSNNLAIASLDENAFKVINSIRSNVASAKINHKRKMEKIYAKYGFESKFGDGYPEWEPNPDSPLLKTVVKAFESYYKHEPVVTAIHAGLECGIINQRVEGMDSLSIGPNLFEVHSTEEHLEAESVINTYGFLKNLVENMKNDESDI